LNAGCGATEFTAEAIAEELGGIGVTMPLYRNYLASGVFGIMALAGIARADSAGEQDEPLSPAITRIMDRPQYANARWGLLQVDAGSGRVRQSLRGAEMFLPGSSAKLFSVSAVWKILGPDTRFTTPVHFLGSRKGGRVEGDLVLVGSGDLTLGGRTKPDGSVDWTNTDHGDANAIPGATLTAEAPLAGIKELARQVRASGITEVQGNVVIDDRLFTSSFEPQPTPVMITRTCHHPDRGRFAGGSYVPTAFRFLRGRRDRQDCCRRPTDRDNDCRQRAGNH
jgi:D-alanyl-D-alanine carboxypeptidase